MTNNANPNQNRGKLYGRPLDENGSIEFRHSSPIENKEQARHAVEREAIENAASEITDLWWARPDQGGHVKKLVVQEIIQRHLWGSAFTDESREVRNGGAKPSKNEA